MKPKPRRYQFPDGANYLILESAVGTLLIPSQDDVANATPKNPELCALAQCAMRIGAHRAFIAGSVAYLVVPWKHGDLVAMRYSVSVRTRAAIKEFDETGEMPLEGFILNPVPHSMSSAGKKPYNDNREATRRVWGGHNKDRSVRPEMRTYRYLSGHVQTTS